LLIGYIWGVSIVKSQRKAMQDKPLTKEDYDMQSEIRFTMNLVGKEKMEVTTVYLVMFLWPIFLFVYLFKKL